MWATVSALGDRDTTCAIVGGIVALKVGDAGLPEEWRSARESLIDWEAAEVNWD
jgi:ADP-ribosylglycohydrolase